MWLLVFLLGIQMQMPTWYWVIFTILTLMNPVLKTISICLENEIKKSMKEIVENK